MELKICQKHADKIVKLSLSVCHLFFVSEIFQNLPVFVCVLR